MSVRFEEQQHIKEEEEEEEEEARAKDIVGMVKKSDICGAG